MVWYFTFSEALQKLKSWLTVTREWRNNPSISVRLQRPDENSLMTEPYLYMIKWDKKFPLDLSCESVLAEDWFVI